MTDQLNTHWHHECTDCGVFLSVSFQREDDGEYEPMPMPKDDPNGCPLCHAPWGPWVAGPAPTEDEEEL